MAVARDLRLRKAKTSSLLPPYWNTLYKITRLSDAMLERLIDDGTMRPDTTYAEINKVLRLERVSIRAAKHRVAEDCHLRLGPFLHLADYDGTGIQADAPLRSHAVLCIQIRSIGLEPLQDRQSRLWWLPLAASMRRFDFGFRQVLAGPKLGIWKPLRGNCSF
jgi:hypothetical protein